MSIIISKNLKELPQYIFEREQFVWVVKEAYPDMVEDIDEHANMHTESFSFFRYEDEYYILHRDSGTMINWYKNLGRTNTCNKVLELWELKEFIEMFQVEMKYAISNLKTKS